MRIRAKTKFRDVVIIGFVTRYNETYAVAIREDGSLWNYPIRELTITDTYLKGGGD